MTRARWWVAALLLLVTLPLLPYRVAPLNDLPDHIGRYHIAANLARSADLQRHWIHAWRWIGNLGVDRLRSRATRPHGSATAARRSTSSSRCRIDNACRNRHRPYRSGA